jgi:single-strand DNA-binding protein
MKGIACAFEARLGRDAEIKTARATGRQFVAMSVIEGDGEDAQWLNVVAWSESLAEIASHLTKGTEVYVQGKLKLRSWQDAEGNAKFGLSVSADLVQPLALIGHAKPKAPRKTGGAGKSRIDPQAPIEFADGADISRGDALPF